MRVHIDTQLLEQCHDGIVWDNDMTGASALQEVSLGRFITRTTLCGNNASCTQNHSRVAIRFGNVNALPLESFLFPYGCTRDGPLCCYALGNSMPFCEDFANDSLREVITTDIPLL